MGDTVFNTAMIPFKPQSFLLDSLVYAAMLNVGFSFVLKIVADEFCRY